MSVLTSPTLQNLISSVRSMLNQRDPNNSFWSDSEIASYLDEGVRVYFAECVLENEGYFTTQTGPSATTPDLNIVANQETVALPSDCFQVKNVWKVTSTDCILLPYRNSLTEGYSSQGGSADDSYLPYYYFQGNNLVLRPTPNGSQTAAIRLEYIQFPDQMIYGGDAMTSQVSPVFKQVIEMYAVSKAKLKESLVNGVIVNQVADASLANLYAQFRSIIQKRSKNPTYVIPFNPENE